MLQTFKNGQTSVVLRAKLLDSSSTTGAGLTGLTSASSGLIIATIADNEASTTAYTVAGSTIETITTLGTYAAPTATKCRFKEVDSTNHKGVYEFHFADARFAVSSAKSLLISVLGATNLQQSEFLVQLQTDDPFVAKPSNSNLLSIDGNGRVDVIKIAGTTQTARDIGASVLLSSGTGTGQLSFTSGILKVDLDTIKTNPVVNAGTITFPTGATLASTTNITAGTITTVTTVTNQLTAAAIATGVWQDATAGDFTAANSIGKSVMNGVALGTGLTVNDITTKTGFSLSSSQTFNLTGNITGNLSGSVGSVTGAVGSVTGSVASVTAGVTVTTNNDKTGYALTSGERNSVADAILDRDMSTGTDSGSTTVRTVRQALRFLRNKWAISAGVLSVYKEDDATASWTSAITTDAAAVPIISTDPAGP